jgi:hypothetical protein
MIAERPGAIATGGWKEICQNDRLSQSVTQVDEYLVPGGRRLWCWEHRWFYTLPA